MKKVWHYRVVGRGAFPVDMLRYDRATFLNSDEEAEARIDWRTLVDSGRYGLSRSFAMESPNPPTVGRWNSFGWRVEEM